MEYHLLIARGQRALAFGILVVAAVLAPATAQAQDNPEVIHAFDANSPRPEGNGLVMGPDGLLYGAGCCSANALGAVFRVMPTGSLEVLHEFTGPDGRQPIGLLLAGDGNFYGVTLSGGKFGVGTAYRISPQGEFELLHSFNTGEGQWPGSLLQAKDGLFYGVMRTGGASNNGTAFRMASNGKVEVLHQFTGSDGDAGLPLDLMEGSDGVFYGTCVRDGKHKLSRGAVFKMHHNGQVRVVHSFKFDGSEGSVGGAALTEGPDGLLYGVGRPAHGQHQHGLIYRVDRQGHYEVFYDFPPPREVNGREPWEKLTLGHDGAFYGTTKYGNEQKFGGTIFRLAPNGTLTTLYHFDDESAVSIAAATPLLETADGVFVGTTALGGEGRFGTIFRLTVLAD